MDTKVQQAIFSGIIATLVMTLFMVLGAAMGMPEMSPPQMLAAIMGVSVVLGWVLHFLIGVIFAAGYVYLFNHWLRKISNRVARGAVYGLIAFIVAQLTIPLLEGIFGNAAMAPPEGSMAMLMIGSITGHVLFGIVVALMVKPSFILSRQMP